jgi:hypothetical protein
MSLKNCTLHKILLGKIKKFEMGGERRTHDNEMRISFTMLLQKPLAKPGRWEYNIKMDILKTV